MFNNHPQWSETFKPGEQATLPVSFDPTYHGPEGIGLQQKAIRITAVDIQKPLAEIRLTATVVEESGVSASLVPPGLVSMARKGRTKDGTKLGLLIG
jgi:hypothetical protein